ncbi:glycine zipper 2TM domain-containing protein [Sphingomonas sp. RT2P30]|uniref:glycine zipper 2TM domain-containing protein n=1 Tax=Parasphingomonas halimpatiens TaxID=3096162 RepID=UPI002FC8AAA5
MKKTFFALSLAATALVPAAALAQTSCEQQRSTRVVATVGGAGVGALVGSSVAGRGDRTLGAIIGGIGGAVLGNQIARPSDECRRAYGFYDRDARWHASANPRGSVTGYIDRDGQWVDGAPNGYYGSDGRWQANGGASGERGYYDASDRWVPAGASGYYGSGDQWMPAMAPGHYERGGTWVSGRVSGHYDRNGTWIGGSAPSRQQPDGSWSNASAPGYYDARGGWHAGATSGFYDGNGRWVATDGSVTFNADTRGRDGYGDGRDHMGRGDRPADLRGQIGWLDRNVRHALDSGALNRRDGRRLLGDVQMLDRQERGMRHYRGNLSPRDDATIRAGVNRLSARLDARASRRTN